MKLNHRTIVLAIATVIVPQQLVGQPCEQVIHKEFTIGSCTTLKLENLNGHITVKTDATQKNVLLKATKKTAKEENLATIRIKDVRSAQQLTIMTEYANDNTKGSVDYVLILPRSMNVDLSTEQGNIKINQLNGTITAVTDCGNIDFINCQGKVIAETGKGNITSTQTAGSQQLQTVKGNIVIEDPNNSITASTEQTGNISITCSKPLPTLCKVKLETKIGDITLAMPKTTSADIHARAERGIVTSDHLLTRKAQTLKLTPETLENLKHEFCGTLGKGDTRINLASAKSNIKILVA